MKRRVSAISLALCLLIMAILCACGKKGGTGDGGTGTAGKSTEGPAATTAPAETEEEVTLDLPEGFRADGYSFRIFTYQYGNTGAYAHYFVPDESETSTVSAAAHLRNSYVEELLGCEIVCIENPTIAWVVQKLYQSILDYEDYCDICEVHIMEHVASMLTAGALFDYTSMPNVDLEKPYYSQGFNDVFNVEGSQYLMSGSLVNAGNMPLFVYFNKAMMEDLGKELPYDTVFNGGWTFDVFTEYCRNVYSDIDGENGPTGGDRYAIADLSQSYAYLFAGFNINTVTTDENGKLVPYLVDEKIVKAQNMLNDLYWNNENVFHGDGFSAFKEGNALFNVFLSSIQAMREIDAFDYGIAPFPKYDERQTNYTTYVPVSYNVTPITISDPEITGAILEALNYESYKVLAPAYVEDYIEQKILRDPESVEVFHLANEYQFIEFTRYLPFTTDIKCYNHIVKMLDANNTSIAAWAEEHKDAYKDLLTQFYEFVG